MSKQRLIGAFVIAAVVVAVLVFRLWQPLERQLTPEEAQQLLHRKNVANGQLENQQLEVSIPVFEEIGSTLPREPLGPRNLAVARIVALGEEFQRATPGRLRQAREALNSMRTTEGESVPYHWLCARLAAARQDNSGAALHLGRIVEVDPDNASAWFELFQRRREIGGTATQSALESLDRAVSLQPQNLFVWMEYFRQAEEQLPKLAQTPTYSNLLSRLETASRTLAPFQYELDIAGAPNVGMLLSEASAAVRSDDLVGASERLGQVSRLILPLASADLAQVRRHPLEFMLDRFDDEFYTRFNLREFPTPPAIEVRFVAADRLAIPDGLLNDRKTIEHMALADFDLDGRADIVFVDRDQVRVLGRAAGGDQWRLIAQAELPAGTRGLIVQDLDLDFDESRTAVPRGDTATVGESTPEQDCLSADVDLVAFGDFGVRLFRNVLDAESNVRMLEAVGQSWGEMREVRAAEAADVDGDGDLDLLLVTPQGLSIWSNRGNGLFADITSRSQFDEVIEPVTAIVPVDLDRDLDIDFIVASSSRARLAGKPSARPAPWASRRRGAE